MIPEHELTAHLPAPRGDDPPGLRDEILAELADHLQCASQREREAGGDVSEPAVWRRVCDRFGDPAVVALTLWRDALWRPIMFQRVLVGLCVCLALSCLGSLGVSWVLLSRQQQLLREIQLRGLSDLEEQRSQIARLEERTHQRELEWKQQLDEARRIQTEQQQQAEEARDAEQAARLRALQPTVSDWNPVEFRFVSDTDNHAPLPGVQVQFVIKARETGIPPLKGTSDAAGVVQFPRVRYGQYTLDVTSPNGESLTETIELQPGEGLERTITCPTSPLENAPVTVRVAWPAEVPADRLACVVSPRDCRHLVDHRFWTNNRLPRWGSGARGANVGPSSQLVIQHAEPVNSWYNSGTISGGFAPRGRSSPEAETSQLQRLLQEFPVRFFREPQQPPEPKRPFVWPGAGYAFSSLEIFTLSPRELKSDPRFHLPQPTEASLKFRLHDLPGDQVTYRLERERTDGSATLWIEPLPQGVEGVRQALARFDELSAQLTPEASSEPESR